MLFSKPNLRSVMAITMAVLALLAIAPHKVKAQNDEVARAFAMAEIVRENERIASLEQAIKINGMHSQLSASELNQRFLDIDEEIRTSVYRRAAATERYIKLGGKLSALGALGIGAAALTGYSDVQASAVRGVTVDGNGAPKPLTVKGSNIGAASSVGAILGTQSAQPGAAERAAARTAK